MKEEEFFNQMARRLGRQSPLREPPERDLVGAPEFWHDYQLTGDEQISKFSLELEKLGGTALVFSSQVVLLQGLNDLLVQLKPTKVAAWAGEFAEEFELNAVLEGYDVVHWGNGLDSVHEISKADVGITGCDYAIADTGTVVLLSDPAKGRSVSLLPSVHVVLVKASQMRTRMGEVWEDIRQFRTESRLPSSINFISGPSRSSDIENDLSIGVHGPAAVFALIWNDR